MTAKTNHLKGVNFYTKLKFRRRIRAEEKQNENLVGFLSRRAADDEMEV